MIRKRGQSGQGTVELILTLFAFLTVAFMYVQVALGLGVANFIHYATFMSARAYLSGGVAEINQRKAAEGVLVKMLKRGAKDRFDGAVKTEGEGVGTDVAGAFIGASPRVKLGGTDARQNSWEQGVTYKFTTKLYMLPLVPGAKRGKANSVLLESQSWLGRDPSEEECIKGLQRRGKISGVSGGDFLFDNGC